MAVGVPGTPALLALLHERHGRLDRVRLAAPAIAAAEDGFAVSPRLSASIGVGAERGLADFPDAAKTFFDAAGAAQGPEVVVNTTTGGDQIDAAVSIDVPSRQGSCQNATGLKWSTVTSMSNQPAAVTVPASAARARLTGARLSASATDG